MNDSAPSPSRPHGPPREPASDQELGLAISDIERILCAPIAAGVLEDLQPRRLDAWAFTLPDLTRYADRPVSAHPARICIATEQIAGPVRNGGIGNTYAALANVLAEAGFDVTVLYLRGQQCETETMDHWVEWYAQKRIRLVPVPDYAQQESLRTGADRWLRGPYNMLRWLIDNPMDVVHVSEWRGSAWLSLLAKRQGLALQDTLFVVKTSSPWLWNRLYGAHTLDKADDLVKIHAERRSVEMADMVIGGSLHLLRWMSSQGYDIPRGRTFVQPNVATFTTIAPLLTARTLPRGERTPIDEFVFFGRLESRKGLFIFCQAIRRMIRKGIALPPRITFMGKPGARMASHPDQDTPDYIREVTADWPTEVQILTGFQQLEAVSYLLGGPRLAVMPSIIENSSMAIYEAAICGIPTVATDVGGNAELIDAADHAAVLCQPHPVSLADKLEEALALGGMVARPSFDNDANLDVWRHFHRQLGGPLRAELLAAATAAQPRGHATPGRSSVCIYVNEDVEALAPTLASLAAQTRPPCEVLVGVDTESTAAMARAAELLAAHGFAPRVIEAYDLDAGLAFNALAGEAAGEHLLFLWEGATLRPDGIATLEGIASTSGAEVLSWLHRIEEPGAANARPILRAVMLGIASDGFFRSDTRELPLFVKARAFHALEGFTTDYRVIGYDHEFAARAQLAGRRCETALAELGTIRARSTDWMRLRGYDMSGSGFRVTRPMLAAAPLGVRDLLLLARGLHLRGHGGGGKGKGDPAQNPEHVLARMIAGLALEKPEGEARPRKANRAAAGTATG